MRHRNCGGCAWHIAGPPRPEAAPRHWCVREPGMMEVRQNADVEPPPACRRYESIAETTDRESTCRRD